MRGLFEVCSLKTINMLEYFSFLLLRRELGGQISMSNLADISALGEHLIYFYVLEKGNNLMVIFNFFSFEYITYNVGIQ